MSKGGRSQTSTTNTIAEPWEGAQPFLRQLLGGASSAYGGGQLDIPPWPGLRVAPQSGMTQAGQQMTFDTAMGGNPFMAGAQGAFGDLASGDVNSHLARLKENVLGDVIPATSHLFSDAGMLDSSMAADTVGRAAASAVAPIEFGAWENAQNRRLSALGMTPELSSARYIDPMMLSSTGQGLDAFNQRVLDAGIGQWYEQMGRPYDTLQRGSALGMGFGGMGATEQRTGSQPSPDPFLSTVGGLMQAATFPLLIAKLSDRRLKTAIRRIGETAEGYPKYAFRYLWDAPGKERVGVIADEVPQEITLTDPLGFKWVNYAGVTL